MDSASSKDLMDFESKWIRFKQQAEKESSQPLRQ